MNTDLIHHHDHAVIALEGRLDWPRCRALLHSIGTAVDYYGYRVVEIQVDSPGGNGRPLRYILDCLDAYRAKGVRFRTCVLSHASSAGAVLVALGDDRVAAPGARLLFHGSRIYRRGEFSARECADLHTALSRSDDDVIRRLVRWAFAAPFAEPVHGTEHADREVLECLCIGAVSDPEDTATARIQTLATALGQTVDEAIHANDRESLARLYGRLFEIGKPISGKLARTLRIVDRIGDSSANSSISPGNPGIGPPEGIPFASPAGDLARETLLRHVLVLGDDAGAATSLCLAPLVTALARAPMGEVGPVLVLNPDPELRAVLDAVADARVEVLDRDRLVLDLMPGNCSLVPALEAGQWMTAATSILKRTVDLVPGSPARFFLDMSGRVVDPVVREGALLVLSVTAFVLLLTSRHSPLPEGWLPHCPGHREVILDLRERARGADGERGPNTLALVSWVLRAVLGYVPARIAEAATGTLGRCGQQGRELVQGLCDGAEALSSGGDHARAVLAVAMAIVAPFSDRPTRTSLYFGCEAGYEPEAAFDVATLVSGARDARFLVLEPREDSSDALVAIGVKQVFLEAALDRPRSEVGFGDAPLCGYIARDFERYAGDIDRAFLDRARVRGGFAILASKCVSAIEHALRQVPGGEATFGALWSGAGTKLLLRSTDPRTQELARGLAPCRPGISHVLDVRPLTGLGPDESCVSRVDGRFERRRLVPWTGTEPEQGALDPTWRVLDSRLPSNPAPEGELS